tara:strand:+ start:104 stop:787 length:684 start_codon:yes stop_codon:yes gene_type:complete
MNDAFLDFFKASIVAGHSSPEQTEHLLFLRIPKNASSSIMDALGSRNITKRYEQELRDKLDRNIYKDIFDVTHARPDELRKVISSIELDCCFSFAVVRNPWDRVVSMYHFGRKMGLAHLFGLNNDLSFDDFCEALKSREGDRSFLPVFKQIEWINSSIKVNEVLRFENLQQDFQNMLEKYDIERISPILPHINKTNHKNYRDHFNFNTKKIIKTVFEEDCDEFKYNF